MRFARKVTRLAAVASCSVMLFGSCVTSGQLTGFGQSQVISAISTFIGQVVTIAVRSSRTAE